VLAGRHAAMGAAEFDIGLSPLLAQRAYPDLIERSREEGSEGGYQGNFAAFGKPECRPHHVLSSNPHFKETLGISLFENLCLHGLALFTVQKNHVGASMKDAFQEPTG